MKPSFSVCVFYNPVKQRREMKIFTHTDLFLFVYTVVSDHSLQLDEKLYSLTDSQAGCHPYMFTVSLSNTMLYWEAGPMIGIIVDQRRPGPPPVCNTISCTGGRRCADPRVAPMIRSPSLPKHRQLECK